ncbi:MAG: bifunctional 4-hydroxy-2-oxoglutarate aldolase/2-dehydro-3-deoxy-phosphogluconate aldolase [Sphingomonadales bacterium]
MTSIFKAGISDIFKAGRVIPVLSFQDVGEALLASRTLYDAGMRVFEITLRHESALASLRAVYQDLPADAIVGAGTVMSPSAVNAAMDAGAAFGVSPGLTPALTEAVQARDWPFLPGVATISEAMLAHDQGFKALKFFPASTSGGPGFLKAAGAVLPELRFCPTGGISPDNAEAYLANANTPVVGGSWIVTRADDGRIDLETTREKAVAALSL